MSKYLLTAAVILIFGVIIIKIPPVYSQNSCTSAAVANDAVIQDVLIKSPVLNKSLLTSGNTSCAIDPDRTKIPSFSIPTFNELKSVYFEQAKTTDFVLKNIEIPGNATKSQVGLTGNKDQLYSITGNLTMDSSGDPPGVKRNGLIFVTGDLNINNNIDYGNDTSGIVFIVQGNVYINPSVTEVNAVIVTLGKFCSSWNGSCAVAPGSQSLTIRGSIISLSKNLPADKPVFNRSLANNSTPAEKIIFQPKYLIIMKNLLGKNINIWSEVQ